MWTLSLFFIWLYIPNSQALPRGLPNPEPLEEQAEEQNHLTSITYTLALSRTSLLSLLSSLGFSYKLSHLLINCCLPIWWTAADFKEANATFFSLQVCLPERFRSLFGLSYWLLPLLITPSCTQSPFLVNQATANYSERSLMIKGWLPKGLTLISFLNS